LTGDGELVLDGKLRWAKSGAMVVRTSVKGKAVTRAVGLEQLDDRLRARRAVETAVKLRLRAKDSAILGVLPSFPPGQGEEAGQGRESASSRTATGTSDHGRSKEPPTRHPAGGKKEPAITRLPVAGGKVFANPYNFVPTPSRQGIPKDQELGDGDPRALGLHDRFAPGRLSGRLQFRLVTESPLVVLDSSRATGDGEHHAYPVRLDPASPPDDPRPLLSPTAVKGMLRSAFETITNSRFGVFAEHSARLGRREESRRAVNLVPARVDEDGRIRLLPGRQNAGGGRPFLAAAWIASYPSPSPSGADREHGQKVWAWLRPVGRTTAKGREYPRHLWRVVAIEDSERDLPTDCPKGPTITRETYLDRPEPLRVEGWVCRTGRNIKGKHDERLFFATDGGSPQQLSDEAMKGIRDEWAALIKNSRDANARRIERRERREMRIDDYEPKEPALSWHLHEPTAGELAPTTLAYARLRDDRVVALYPVSIPRVLDQLAPGDLLVPSLRPARAYEELSPADRVFGWVSDHGTGAWAGLVRVGRVRCGTSASIQPFNADRRGLPLAILGEPKPGQARFYLARDDGGEPLSYETEASQGYVSGRRLRGRKVHPHQPLLSRQYWGEDPEEDWLSSGSQSRQGAFQEYRRPRKDGDEQRDSQNRSIGGWVKPETLFTFDLRFRNLSQVELGAFLWLGSLDSGRCLRLGYGRPLGFGSVRLSVDRLEMSTGEERAATYRALTGRTSCADLTPADRGRLVEDFEEAVRRAYRTLGQFSDLSFVRGFLAATAGSSRYPVHYPRSTPEPRPEGESFRWFVANERSRGGQVHRYELPHILDDPGLPILRHESSGDR
jgi:CRISPR-associated protein (TIGR03986 family)